MRADAAICAAWFGDFFVNIPDQLFPAWTIRIQAAVVRIIDQRDALFFGKMVFLTKRGVEWTMPVPLLLPHNRVPYVEALLPDCQTTASTSCQLTPHL